MNLSRLADWRVIHKRNMYLFPILAEDEKHKIGTARAAVSNVSEHIVPYAPFH